MIILFSFVLLLLLLYYSFFFVSEIIPVWEMFVDDGSDRAMEA